MSDTEDSGTAPTVDERDLDPIRTATRFAAAALFAVLLSGCSSATPGECPTLPRIDLSQVDPNDDTLPFRYPLDVVAGHLHDADFCEHSSPGGMFHAAEDLQQPAGTEVYAMADGEVSFSGTMGGYGWLVIVDHPEVNVYSLYGHLSPSRWRAEPGPVAKGDLVGYLPSIKSSITTMVESNLPNAEPDTPPRTTQYPRPQPAISSAAGQVTLRESRT